MERFGLVILLVGLLMLSGIVRSAGATTTVGGEISADTTWTAANSPYVVQSSVTVDSGVTLTIEAGTIIKVDPHEGIFVNGTLTATGTSESLIYFTAYDDDTVGGGSDLDNGENAPEPGQWAGIQINDGGSAYLSYSVVRYGGSSSANTNIYKEGSGGLHIENTTVSGSSGSGVYIKNSGSGHSISNSFLSHNVLDGLTMRAATGGVDIAGCTFSGNNASGIFGELGSILTIRNNILTANGYGLFISGETLQPDASGNTISGNTISAIRTYAANLVPLSESSIAGKIELDGGGFSHDLTLNAANVYQVNSDISVTSGTTLTVPSGAMIKLKEGGIMVYGNLTANGTSENRIYFTDWRDDTVGGDTNGDGGVSFPVPGGWNAISIEEGGSATLNNTVVRYGGGAIIKMGDGSLNMTNSVVSNGGGINIYASNANHTITDCSISNNNHGINLDNVLGSVSITGSSITGNSDNGIISNAGTLTLQNNTITGNYYGLCLTGSTLLPVAGGNTVSGNIAGQLKTGAENLAPLSGSVITGKVEVDGGAIIQNTTLSASGIYQINDNIVVNSGKSLAMPAGTVIKFINSTGLNIYGSLLANGTSGNKVYFTDWRDDSIGGDSNDDGNVNKPGPGWWNGIQVYDGGMATLSYAVVRYGVNNLHKQGAGSLNLSNSTVTLGSGDGVVIDNSGADHSISNCIINRNTGNGIKLEAVTGTANIFGSSISGNGGSGIHLIGANAIINGDSIGSNNVGVHTSGGANPIIGGSAGNSNNIFRNTQFGVQNADPSVQVNATYNWWGAASGPYHATLNPSGTGNAVSDNVVFDNYLAVPTPAIPIEQVSPESFYFKHVMVGAISLPQVFTVTNTGNSTLIFATAGLDGQNSGDFHITADTCSGQSITSGGSCSVSVTFAPTGKFARNAELAIPSTDPLNPVLAVPLSGYGATPLPFTEEFRFADGIPMSFYLFAVNYNASLVNPFATPGALRLFTNIGDLWNSATNAQNVIVLPMPSGLEKYMVTAKFVFPALPSGNNQQGGVILCGENGNQPELVNHVRSSYGYINGSIRFQTDTDVNGVSANYDGPALPSPYSTVWLRLVKRGNNYQTLYSSDNITFNPVNSVTGSWDVAYAGFYAMNGGIAAANIPIDFDNFTVTPLPSVSISSPTMPFGNVVVNSAPPPQNLIISNTGSSDLVVSELNLTGTDIALFSIGEGTCGPLPITVPPQGACALPVIFTPSGGGNKSATLQIVNNDADNPTVAVSLSGNVQYSISVTGTIANGTISCVSPVDYNANSVCTITPNTGYHLASFSVNGVDKLSQVSGNSYTIANVTTNQTVTGSFAINTYTVSVTGIITNGTMSCTSPVNYGTNSVCTMTSNTGYHLASFSVNGVDRLGQVSDNSYTISNITADQTVTGSFAITTYTVAITGTITNGIISCTSPVNYGSDSVCTMTPNSGYMLSAFSINGMDKLNQVSDDSYTITNITANQTVTGAFALIRQLQVTITGTNGGGGSVHSTPTGISCANGNTGLCLVNFADGTIVTLIPTADANSLFFSWVGDGKAGTGNSRQVTMDGNKSVTVTFNYVNPARILSTLVTYTSISAAYGAMTTNGTIQARQYEFTEKLILSNPLAVILQGGYNPAYNDRSSNYSTINGTVTIQKGSLAVDKLVIK